MDVAALLDRVWHDIDEEPSDTGRLTNAVVLAILNVSYVKASRDTQLLARDIMVDTVDGHSLTALPADVINVSQVRWGANRKPCPKVDVHELQAVNPDWADAAAGLPRYSYLSDDLQLGLYPPPNGTGPATCRGIVIPLENADADQYPYLTSGGPAPALPEVAHLLLVHHAVYFIASYIRTSSESMNVRAQQAAADYAALLKQLTG